MPPVRRRAPKKRPVINIPGGIIYTPPGRDLDIRKWDREDTDLWMSCFLRPDKYPEVFLAATKHHLDGESLYWMTTVNPIDQQNVLNISKEPMDMILRMAACVINEKNRVKYEEEMAEWKLIREAEMKEREQREAQRRERQIQERQEREQRQQQQEQGTQT